MNSRIKNIIIAVLALLVITLSIIIVMFLYKKGESTLTLEGTVIISQEDYLLIETDDKDYVIDETYEFKEGDTVKVTYKEKDIDEKSTPSSIKAQDIDLLKEAEVKEEKPSTPDTTTQEKPSKPNTSSNQETTSKPQVPTSPNNSSTTKPSETTPETKTADVEVLEYFEEVDKDFKSGTIKDSLKSGFVTVIDFLFYNKPIKGHTFKNLSMSAKLKVLSMGLYFDEKIDKYFPGYKESISSTTNKVYTTAKKEIVETYLNVAVKVCEQDADLCVKAKDEFSKIKTNFGLTWSLIKEIAGDGISNLKNWYEIWRNK